MLQQLLSRIRNSIIAIVFYVGILLVALVIAIPVLLFTLIYILAILGPWVMGKFSIRAYYYKLIDWIFGIDSIHNFRDDIREMISNHGDFSRGDRALFEVREDILELHEEASRRAERGEFVIAILAGILSLIIGNFTGISVAGLLIGIYSFVMSLTIGLHVVVLDVLAYSDKEELKDIYGSRLLVIEAWNRTILSKRRFQAMILAVGLLRKVSPFGYNLANELLDESLGRDMTAVKSSIFIVRSIAVFSKRIISTAISPEAFEKHSICCRWPELRSFREAEE